jgi:HK97 family phage major capsid protein
MSAQAAEQWESQDLKALSQIIAEKNEEQRTFYNANKGRWDNDRVTIFENRNKELEKMVARQKSLQKVEDIYNTTVNLKKDLETPAEGQVPFENRGGNVNESTTDGRRSSPIKSLGEAVADVKEIKEIGSWENLRQPFTFNLPNFMFQSGMKTVMTTAAGFSAASPRTDVVVPYAQRTPRLADLIPVRQTNLRTINYMEETTALAGTNAQVSITEGNLKFENAMAFTARSAGVETVGTWLPVTTQQLDDVEGIQGIIENRMDLFLRLKEEDLLLNGTGTPPQLIGFQGAAATAVLSQARGTDTNIDAVFKAIQQIRVTGLAEPDAVVMHPDNFTPIALYKATTGEYGFDVTVDNAGIVRLWGKILIQSPVATAGTALVGAFREFSEIWRKMGMTVMVGLNSDDFTKNKRTILGEFREALTIYRQTAFCKVTGLQ